MKFAAVFTLAMLTALGCEAPELDSKSGDSRQVAASSDYLTVDYDGTDLPPGIAGEYVHATDCRRDEGGAWFGGVDYGVCYRKTDGSSWRIWNTGCGWEIGQSGWQRYARTYSGYCAEIPETQLGTGALTTSTFFDGFGNPIVGLRSGPTVLEQDVVNVEYSGVELPSELAGLYVAATDCARSEGGAWFGGVDFEICYRKLDGSNWRIWNTGCGWEIGEFSDCDEHFTPFSWERHARTFSGYCAEIPDEQLDSRALTTATFFDPFGNPIEGLRSTLMTTAP